MGERGEEEGKKRLEIYDGKSTQPFLPAEHNVVYV